MAGTLTVNPTRMELTRLKRRLKTATRGHKLLKDKRDEMMRRFVLLIRENQRIRLQVEEKLGMALGEFAICRGAMDSAMLEQALQTVVQYADSAMVGQLGAQSTAAVGITTPVSWLVNAPMFGILAKK